MIAKTILIILFFSSYSSDIHAIRIDDSFFDIQEKHELQVPQMLANAKGSRVRVRQNLVEKLLTIIKDRPSDKLRTDLISGPEVLGIRDLLLQEKYKAYGAVPLPNESDDNVRAELEGFDKLFTQDGEKHTYDERGHRDNRILMAGR